MLPLDKMYEYLLNNKQVCSPRTLKDFVRFHWGKCNKLLLLANMLNQDGPYLQLQILQSDRAHSPFPSVPYLCAPASASTKQSNAHKS